MAAINDGGPAFPQNDLSGYGMGPSEANNGGMTLRDWFAGQALVSILAGDGAQYFHQVKEHARLAYDQADAMLKAREAE